jgi:hypothetical protein
LESPETLLFPVNDDKPYEENENGKNNTNWSWKSCKERCSI